MSDIGRIRFTSVGDYCEQTRRWLSAEREEEVRNLDELLRELPPIEIQIRGLALLRLVVSDITSGLYGKVIATFIPKYGECARKKEEGDESTKERKKNTSTLKLLPTHRLTTGDIVGVFNGSNGGGSFHVDPISTGVVHQVRKDCISVAFDSSDKENGHLSQSGKSGTESLNFDFSACDHLVHLALVSSEVTSRRQFNVLSRLENSLVDK